MRWAILLGGGDVTFCRWEGTLWEIFIHPSRRFRCGGYGAAEYRALVHLCGRGALSTIHYLHR
uniref:Uncharacterized protein n=1 Tax=Anopheles arabiensis TaxID=7173 RepID=A0A182IFV0_ANOAR